MGLFPDKQCLECKSHYYSCDGKHHHCQILDNDIARLRVSLGEAHDLIECLIAAYRARGECVDELKQVAYWMGMSVRSDEFVWLDEEIKRLKDRDSS